ncbi:pentatricopeptide repeat protein [Actinophytocola oryzae]|uniref:Pentatricopeptide repeat protein n=1 Tax=Actinophytocola oryzae TaxID=502181 RepID=A0A4R7V3T7_9PSEU|nr:pentatricopeptide repeat protein [Actinophytocola oryzae]
MARLDELTERRLATVERWAQAALAAGRHHDVAAELRREVATHPLRERLYEHWMHALCRAGRPADALAAYERLHAEMAAELGVAPGQALADLRAGVLADDPVLRPRDGRAPAVLPRQLPPDVAGFTGRAEEIDRLARVPVAVVAGPGGIGESALAVHAAHLMAHRFPDVRTLITRGRPVRRP